MAARQTPWDSVPVKDTFFALVTGANSGIGLGICERLIDTFLATRSLQSHLILIPTTRSVSKSNETISALYAHLSRTATTCHALRARGATDPADALARVHIISLQIDLCDLLSLRRAVLKLRRDTVLLCSADGTSKQVCIPRLDALIFNAGIGGWTHLDWLAFCRHILVEGYVEATTWPTAKMAEPGRTITPLLGCDDTIGEVFCANVFGHYLLAHWLMDHLRRGPDPARIIWQGSGDATSRHFSLDDLQAVRSTAPYESTKTLTDLLCLTADLPAAKRYSAAYFGCPPPWPGQSSDNVVNAKFHIAHPGVVATTLFPLHFLMMAAYKLGLLLARWLGSPWHPVTAYNGAFAAVWLALAAPDEVDTRCKWGSATDFWGNCLVKKTEVEGWGWEGRVETEASLWEGEGVLRKAKGRTRAAEMVTEEKLALFEELGAMCWREMEMLRAKWEERMSDLQVE